MYTLAEQLLLYFSGGGSKGINAKDISEQFVNLTVALESLLVDSRGNNPMVSWGGIAQKIADSICFLSGGPDYNKRLELIKEVKTLYGKRSRIVHSGGSPTLKELNRLSIICRNAILGLLYMDLDSWEDWLKQRLYRAD